MDERQAVFAELEAARERAAGLLQAKLQAVAAQVREAAARAAGDLEVVVPPDLEMLLPLAPAGRLLTTPPPPVAPPATVAIEAVRKLDTGRAQSEVLKEFLSQLEGLCGPRAILVFRDTEVVGWSSLGFRDDAAVRSFRGRLADSAAFAAVAQGTPVLLDGASDLLLAGLLEDGGRVLLVPMSLRGKVVGAALAAEGDHGLASDVVQILTYLTGLLLETLAVRPVVPTPAIVEPLVLTPETGTVGAAVEGAGERELLGLEAAETAAVPSTVVEVVEAAPEPEPAVESALETGIPVTPAEAAPRSPEEEQRHGEARRFARLLVSEIRLYNEQAVQDGRTSRDIYQRLKEDIDRSREMYEQRVPPEVRAASNYFFEELVRILADGDPDALGL